MRRSLAFVLRRRGLDLAIAVGLGAVGAALAEAVADAGISVVTQHAGRYPFDGDAGSSGLLDPTTAPFLLNFSVGSTIVFYGEVVSTLLAVVLLALVAVAVIRRRDRELGTCPFCASRIPHASTHCAYCGSSMEPDRA